MTTTVNGRELSELSHAAKIARAMAPEPKEWRFTGPVVDTGALGNSTCACGHAIRYEYWLTRARDGARLVVGSTCVDETVPYLIAAGADGLAKDLKAAVKEFRKRQLDERRARDQSGRTPSTTSTTRAKALLAEREALIRWARGERDADGGKGTWLGPALFSIVAEPPEYLDEAGRPTSTPPAMRADADALWASLVRLYVAAFQAVKPKVEPRRPSDRAIAEAVERVLLEAWRVADAVAATMDDEEREEARRALLHAEIALDRFYGGAERTEVKR